MKQQPNSMEDKWCQLEDLDFFDLSQYSFQGLIGASNAPVYRYQKFGSTEEVLALKELKIRDAEDYQRTVENMKTLQRIKQNSHPFIIKIYGFCKGIKQKVYGEDVSAYLVMEYCEGNLDDFIQMRKSQNKMFTAAEVAKFFAQTVSALEFLQGTLNIAHRDIKPENILIHDGDFKIADLDDSKIDLNKTVEKSLVLGTVSFMAPELLKAYLRMKDRLSYNAYRSDVYSLGLCLLYMCTFEKFSRSERIEEEKVRYASKIKQLRQKIKSDYGVLLSKLIKIMLDNDPWKRPDFSTLKETAISKTYLEQEDFYSPSIHHKKASVAFTFPQTIGNNGNANNNQSPQQFQGDVFSMGQSKQIGSGWSIRNLQQCLQDNQIASTVTGASIPQLSSQEQVNQVLENQNSKQNVVQVNEQDRSRTRSENPSFIQSRTYSHMTADQREVGNLEDGSFYTESEDSDLDQKRKSTFTASAIIRFTKHSKDLCDRDESSDSIQQFDKNNFKTPRKTKEGENHADSSNSQGRLRECRLEESLFNNSSAKNNKQIAIKNSEQFFAQKANELAQNKQQQDQSDYLSKNGGLDPNNSSSNREMHDDEEEISCTPSSVNMIESLLKGGLDKEKQRRKSSRGLSNLKNWDTQAKISSLAKQRKIFSVVIAVMVLASVGLGITWLVFSQTEGDSSYSNNQSSESTDADEDNSNSNSTNSQDITSQSCFAMGKFYLDGQCLTACPQIGYFADTDRGICVQCDDSCVECTKGEPNYCKKCNQSAYLLTLSAGAGLCLSDCPNSFRKDSTLNKCLKCPENCLDCASSSQNSAVLCLQCASQYFLLGENLCITVCPKGTTPDLVNNLCTTTTTTTSTNQLKI